MYFDVLFNQAFKSYLYCRNIKNDNMVLISIDSKYFTTTSNRI